MDKHLDAIYQHVHAVVKRLKIGDSAVIPVTKEFTSTELIAYVPAYARHKEKWFDIEYDPTSKVLTATRAPPPPWDVPDEIDEEEEL